MSTKSTFQFKGFKILRSIIDFNESIIIDESKILFSLSGVVKKSESKFELFLGIHITNENGDSHILVESMADYGYDSEKEISNKSDLNDLFYLNSIALLFPHIRAYITALTSLSGFSPIVLPTLNVSSLKDDLKENITIE